MIIRTGARVALPVVSAIIISYQVTVDSATWQEIWEGDFHEDIGTIAAKSDSEAVFFYSYGTAYAYDGSDFIPIAGFPDNAVSGDYDQNGVLWIGAGSGIFKCDNPPFGAYVLETPTSGSYTHLSISRNGEFGLAIVDGSEGYVFDGDEWSAVDPGLPDLAYASDISAYDNDYGAFCKRNWFNVGIYDNGAFYKVPSPVDFDCCSVAGEDDVWFIKKSFGYSYFFHYGNGSWTDYSYIYYDEEVDDEFFGVDFLSSDDGWVKKSWYKYMTYYYSVMLHYNGAGWVPYYGPYYGLECGGGDVKIVDSMCVYTCGASFTDQEMGSRYKAYKFTSGVSVAPVSVGKIKAMFR